MNHTKNKERDIKQIHPMGLTDVGNHPYIPM